METFDTAKFPTFTEENSNKVTKYSKPWQWCLMINRISFKKGLEKELNRLQEELNILDERIEMEENIINEMENA